jgi:hypothetical protein
MSKTLEKIESLPWVAHVDDERGDGGSIIITLVNGYYFTDNPGCGVMGVDNVQEAVMHTRKSSVYTK